MLPYLWTEKYWIKAINLKKQKNVLTNGLKSIIMCKVICFTRYNTFLKQVIFLKNLNITVLLDFYGKLLSDKARDIMEMYYMEDLSLAEIAENKGITRQGVRDNIVRAQKELENFEANLNLLERFKRISANVDNIKNVLNEETEINPKIKSKITELFNKIEEDL